MLRERKPPAAMAVALARFGPRHDALGLVLDVLVDVQVAAVGMRHEEAVEADDLGLQGLELGLEPGVAPLQSHAPLLELRRAFLLLLPALVRRHSVPALSELLQLERRRRRFCCYLFWGLLLLLLFSLLLSRSRGPLLLLTRRRDCVLPERRGGVAAVAAAAAASELLSLGGRLRLLRAVLRMVFRSDERA